MKKILALMIALVLCSTAALAEMVGMANPWTDTDREGFTEQLSLELDLPEGASDCAWRVLAAEGLGELDFTMDGQEFTARVKAADGFEDISGMYYEWEAEDDGWVAWCPAKICLAEDEGQTVELCLWYDEQAGTMYSVATSGADLDGFDILAVAEQLYPASGEVNGAFVRSLRDALTACTGFSGTAGASLKDAIAARGLMDFAALWDFDQVPAEEADASLQTALGLMDEVQAGELKENLPGIAGMIASAFDGDEQVLGLFGDAGAGDGIDALLTEEAPRAAWQSLTEALQRAGLV